MRFAHAQHGVLHLEQAMATGMSAKQVYRLAQTAEWSLILPRVLARVGVGDPWTQRVMAACLWCGRGSAASHSTAAALWDLDGCKRGAVELSVHGRKHTPREWVVVHESIARFAVQRRRGIPATAVARTLIDLGAAVSSGTAERALEDALRRGLTTVHRLQLSVSSEGGRGRRGAATISELLAARVDAPVPESELERRLLRLLARAGLPPPEVQVAVETAQGFRARLDFAYPAARVAIEADGYRWHSGREKWQRDRARSNELVKLGWRILHVTWDDVQSGATDLVAALETMVGQSSLRLLS
jgi:hypothetical protein